MSVVRPKQFGAKRTCSIAKTNDTILILINLSSSVRCHDILTFISNNCHSQIPVGLVLKAVEKSLFTQKKIFVQNNLSSYFPYDDYLPWIWFPAQFETFPSRNVKTDEQNVPNLLLVSGRGGNFGMGVRASFFFFF